MKIGQMFRETNHGYKYFFLEKTKKKTCDAGGFLWSHAAYVYVYACTSHETSAICTHVCVCNHLSILSHSYGPYWITGQPVLQDPREEPRPRPRPALLRSNSRRPAQSPAAPAPRKGGRGSLFLNYLNRLPICCPLFVKVLPPHAVCSFFSGPCAEELLLTLSDSDIGDFCGCGLGCRFVLASGVD